MYAPQFSLQCCFPESGHGNHECAQQWVSGGRCGGLFPGSPVVKTLISNAGSVGSIPGQGAEIPHALGPESRNIKQKQYCNRFSEVKRKSLSCVPLFCYPMDCSPPGASIHRDAPGKDIGVGCYALLQGIFPIQGSSPGLPHCRQIPYQLSHQGSPRILEGVAYSFSGGSS